MTRITIHPTGYPPTTVNGVEIAREREVVDKRGVELVLIRSRTREDETVWIMMMIFLTEWRNERSHTRAEYWTQASLPVEKIAAWVREQAPTILPLGAGFPAIPAYEARQQQLAGRLQSMCLSCIDKILARLSNNV